MKNQAVSKIIFSFVCGLYFALLQFSYFFLMEAFVSSQYLSYFLTLLFWLCGFLLGLNISQERWFMRFLVLGAGAYYIAWTLTRRIPFHPILYPCAALCTAFSGLLPGYFFPYMARRFRPVKLPFFHENNGFILGILISLEASIHMGRWFLNFSVGVGAVGVACVLLAGRYFKSLVLAPVAGALSVGTDAHDVSAP